MLFYLGYKGGLIMPINKNEITKEMIEKAMQCKTVEELMALAKTGGYDISKEEAEAYFAELADVELDGNVLINVAGGHDYFCLHCPMDLQCPKYK